MTRFAPAAALTTPAFSTDQHSAQSLAASSGAHQHAD